MLIGLEVTSFSLSQKLGKRTDTPNATPHRWLRGRAFGFSHFAPFAPTPTLSEGAPPPRRSRRSGCPSQPRMEGQTLRASKGHRIHPHSYAKTHLIFSLVFYFSQKKIVRGAILECFQRINNELYLPVGKGEQPEISSINISDFEKLAALKEKGMITDSEFESMKKRILGI